MKPVDIEMEIINLKEQVLELHKQRLSVQTRLSSLNAEVRGKRLHSVKYDSICKKQNKAKKELESIAEAQGKLKIELAKREMFKEELKNQDKKQSIEVEGVTLQLIELKRKYVSFAADRTRVSSMRAMAAKFVEELDELI